MKQFKNEVVIRGRIGNEPEVGKTNAGTAVCNIRLCVEERWEDKSGEKQVSKTWLTAVAWDWRAEEAYDCIVRSFSI